MDCAGHRIVHGGPSFTSAVVVDDRVRAELESLVDLAPLHLPASLAGLDAVRAALPSVPSVACFDTAFHATIPAEAATYALPAQWRDLGIRRYGFHGLSHAYAARRAAEILELPVDGLRLVSCHLGAGASLCAVHSGRSVDTTMGFTPLEGLVMATRSGSVDPGLVLWLQRQHGLSADEVFDGLESRSGLLGLAGTADMREVLARMDSGDEAARLAFDVYVYRIRAGDRGDVGGDVRSGRGELHRRRRRAVGGGAGGRGGRARVPRRRREPGPERGRPRRREHLRARLPGRRRRGHRPGGPGDRPQVETLLG